MYGLGFEFSQVHAFSAVLCSIMRITLWRHYMAFMEAEGVHVQLYVRVRTYVVHTCGWIFEVTTYCNYWCCIVDQLVLQLYSGGIITYN